MARNGLGIRCWPGIAAACLAACLPALNNGFISDDFVHLEWAETLWTNPAYLFGTPPIGFRPTSFVLYLALKKLFGFGAPFYYLAAIAVHFATCLLVALLAYTLTSNRKIACWSALLFAVIYQAQEPVFYLAAMNESLMVLFGLASILLYLRDRYALAVLSYSLALLSKEAALIIPALVLIVEYGLSARRFQPLRLMVFAGPASVRLGFLVYFASANYYVTEQIHGFTTAIPGVLLLSLHKLTFPWLWIVAAAVVLTRKSSGEPSKKLFWWAAWPVVALLPYATLTYQAHVTSRHFYLAAVGWVVLLALLISRLASARLQAVIVAGFVIFNVSYTWLKKDGQYEARAAQTSRLIEIMAATEPQPVFVSGFPGNPWNAKLTSRLVPGWSPELIIVDEDVAPPPDAIRLRWDGTTYRRER